MAENEPYDFSKGKDEVIDVLVRSIVVDKRLWNLVNDASHGALSTLAQLRAFEKLDFFHEQRARATSAERKQRIEERKITYIPVLRVPLRLRGGFHVNQRFGRLRVIAPAERIGRHSAYQCLCDCGAGVIVRGDDLKREKVKSCGCLNRDLARSRQLKHGLCGTRAYSRSQDARRRAAKAQRTPAWANLDEIRTFYKNCPPGHHVDHIVPLQGENVSGLHVEHNLQYLPASENIRKGNKWQVETV